MHSSLRRALSPAASVSSSDDEQDQDLKQQQQQQQQYPGGYDTHLFVQQPVDPNLICTICHQVLARPTSVCTNGHVSCADCLEQLKASCLTPSAAKCPDCRVPILKETSLIRPLQSIIWNMQVKCPNRNDNDTPNNADTTTTTTTEEPKTLRPRAAKKPRLLPQKTPSQRCCPWTGTLSEYLEIHSKTQCAFLKAACNLCNAQVFPASQLADHKANECDYRLVPCPLNCGTNQPIQARNLQTHLRLDCPLTEIQCRHCREKMPRKDMGTYHSSREQHRPRVRVYTKHLLVCPRVRIPCDFAHHGCKTMVPRQDMPAHLRDCGQEHAQLLSNVLSQVVDQQRWKTKTLIWTIPRAKLAQMKRREGLESQRVKVGDFMAFLQFRAASSLSNLGDNSEIKVKLCVEQPLYTPFVRDVRIRSEPSSEGGANNSRPSRTFDIATDTTVVAGNGDAGTEMMDDEQLTKDTCTMQYDLIYNRERPATVRDWNQALRGTSAITFRATFSLKCPEVIAVACAN